MPSSVLDEFAPGFSTRASDERGIALLMEHFGRRGVLRTHSVDPQTPCTLRSSVEVPSGKKTALVLDVSHDPLGDWRLVVQADGRTVTGLLSMIGPAHRDVPRISGEASVRYWLAGPSSLAPRRTETLAPRRAMSSPLSHNCMRRSCPPWP